ncbi:extracellular solute-binding protein [Geminocystis sp. NIES-3709]|uniref:extracellular solute-binding protein n=1 Tax=Geminocystis sp. NIES-3709 TaxID=1617448 RepID=UPI0005FC4F9B|nr:extracellular solute-binding protein [Geminocystis sp. NIES-3709]BAQ64865.1 ABC transporter [Geminocystis sp. NIES-3709]
MNRRSFLWSIGSISLASLLSGCESQYDLQVSLLQNSIPIQLIASLQKESKRLGIVNFQPQLTIDDIYKLLITWQEKKENNSSPHDLVTLGDFWLKDAIAKKLIEPLELSNLSHWDSIPPRFQNLMKRDREGKLNPNGQLWGAPYRWGYTMIAYRKDKFEALGWQPQDWDDLWRSQIQHRISLLNQPREIIGLILKKLGHSYNTPNINAIPEIRSQLASLHQQVKFYDSINYLQPLILGDTWLAVGWSTDILPIVETHRDIEAIIPRSGTSLWTDIWVKPKREKNEQDKLKKILDLINFCWETKSAKQINLFTNGISPLELKGKSNPKIPKMSPEILAKSDFIEPLSTEDLQQYNNLLLQI